MPNGEVTHPGIDVNKLPVTRGDCKECQMETGRKLDAITATLTRIESKIDTHTSWHEGLRAGSGRAVVSVRTIGTIVSIAVALGAAIWALARTIGV